MRISGHLNDGLVIQQGIDATMRVVLVRHHALLGSRVLPLWSSFSLLRCDPPCRYLETLTSLNREVSPFFLGDISIWSFPSVSSLSDYSIWRS